MLEDHETYNDLELIKRFVQENTYIPVDPMKRRVKEIEKQSIIDLIDEIKAKESCGANDEMQGHGDLGKQIKEIKKIFKKPLIKCKWCGHLYFKNDELDHLDASPSCDNKQTEEDVDSGLMDHGSPVYFPDFLKTQKRENL